MCGICGIIDYTNRIKITEGAIRNMCVKLKHRGPDGEGIYLSNGLSAERHSGSAGVGLGHRRLKIIDLSSAGHQPMSNECGNVWIVFNGEIYNYPELRKSLEANGHVFKSQTDTETIVHLYEDYGKECVKYLRGMFAFAIWDEKNQTLLLARDRIGKKPLFYCFRDGVLSFASELIALLESGLIERAVNHKAIDFYLTYGYIPAPMTIYEDVLKLPPRTILFLDGRGIKSEEYWNLDYSNKIKISENDAAEEMIRLLKDSVKIRMYSDVPLGAFLSGGLDSSAVVGLMSILSGNKVNTFSIGFNEKNYSELKYARKIAQRFNTQHHEFIVEPNAIEILPSLVEHYGEPFADSSCIPSYYVAKLTKEYVTVALNGDGGDEVFAGYERYQGMAISRMYQNLPAFFKNTLSAAAFMLPESVNPRNRMRNLKRFFQAVNLSDEERYFRWVGIFSHSLKKRLYKEDFINVTRQSQGEPLKFLTQYLNDHNELDIVDKLLRADTYTYLPGDLLVKVDITSMMNSLETRSPFLDQKLMEFVARLPSGYKMKNLSKKYLLKKAVKSFLPSENINRRKMGFGVPVGKWFRKELRDFLRDTLMSKTSFNRRYFNHEVVKDMFKLHLDGRVDYTFQLWTLLMLELWHKRFID